MGSKNQTSTTSQNQTYSPTGLSNLQDIYGRAAAAASTPYSPYGGQLTAGLTDTQQNAITGANNAANLAQPYYQQAGQLVTGAANPLTAAQIQQYANPYTSAVIDATRANFAEDNAQQQSQILGNAAAQGALGGDRAAVAQANLARQQKLAQDPVIAGLQSQGYTQALQTAQQQFQQNPMAAATAFGNIGTGAQNAALQGVQGQLTAGGVQQQTNQTGLTNDYQQFLNQLAFPYQQAQFLASIGIPTSGAMGGTTSGQGTSTQPGPNPFSQVLGLGLSAAGLFSDERIKDDITPIGKTFDGQKIYRFKYKNDPVMRIGLMAQDVEKKNPNAVGDDGGIKTVEYGKATDKAAAKGHFASGGAVTPFRGIAPLDFINDARGYVPAPVSISGGSLPSSQPGQMAGANTSPFKPVDDIAPITQGLNSLKGKFAGTPDYGQSLNVNVGNYQMPMFGFPASGSGSTSGFMGFGGLYADGGVVSAGNPFSAYADGGATFDDRFRAAFPFTDPVTPTVAPDGSPTLDDRFAPVQDAISTGAFDPQGKNYTAFNAAPETPSLTAPMTAVAQAPAIVPEPANDVSLFPTLPPQITAPADVPVAPENLLAYSGTGASLFSGDAGSTSAPNAATPGQTMGGWNPFNLSDKARQAIIAAGLGMTASRSPFALSAIGEGGLYGVKAYSDATKAEQDAADKRITQSQNQARIDQEAKRIAQSAEQFAKTYDLSNRRLQKDLDKTPSGYREKDDGTYEPIPGGPADPATLKKIVEAKRVPGAVMDADTAEFLADRVLVGDTRALVGLGRGAQGAENIAMIQSIVARKAREQGIDPTDILAKVAEQSGNMAAQRTFGTNVARMAVNSTEAQGAIELGRAASLAVPRTNWVPVNKAIQAYQSGTSDPALAKFGAANLAIINTYARAISPTGVPTVNDKQHAEHLLSTAMGPDAYNAVLDQMNDEIKIAHAAPLKAKKEMEDIRKGRTSTPTHSASTSSAPAITKTINGKTYVKRGNDWYAQ